MDKRFEKTREVLDARVQLLEARLATELRLKRELRSKQIAITEQGDALSASLQENATKQPHAFHFHEAYLHKLAEDQRRLQPILAQAALQRLHVQDRLKDALRQRLGLTLYLDRKANDARSRDDDENGAQVLFELMKRR
ncbi:hypothetical protein [Marivita sp. XM-24bin2]|uniref:hypothetical protein n=1 Tax=Marivita sp. XM-24bin2 TaxID=2133951 RepID=UPI000D7A480C|nr:hypothetical protein [Marivita sp. XM-24bin2]MCR9109163.1 hypothetical protein [Paracoccaceae bacterium]PWL34731.1 MAG: hypothetical protein DCO97_12685 [Marivita sp. XM-24bin2]